jgi:hypothetical protein
MPARLIDEERGMGAGCDLRAVASGEITPGEAADLAKLVESTAKAIEVHELADRLQKLEEAVAAKRGAA